MQVAAAMWVMAAATVLQLLCKPYEHTTEERLEALSLGGMTVAMMIGQLILQADGASGLGTMGLAVCQGCVIAILMFTMCCFLAFFAREVYTAHRDKKREAGPAKPPPMVMHTNPMQEHGAGGAVARRASAAGDRVVEDVSVRM